jgi:hypothetical protein
MQFLRKAHSEKTLGRDLVVQGVQEDGCRWCLDSLVSLGDYRWMRNRLHNSKDALLIYALLPHQDAGRCCHTVNYSSVEGNCGGLDPEVKREGQWSFCCIVHGSALATRPRTTPHGSISPKTMKSSHQSRSQFHPGAISDP